MGGIGGVGGARAAADGGGGAGARVKWSSCSMLQHLMFCCRRQRPRAASRLFAAAASSATRAMVAANLRAGACTGSTPNVFPVKIAACCSCCPVLRLPSALLGWAHGRSRRSKGPSTLRQPSNARVPATRLWRVPTQERRAIAPRACPGENLPNRGFSATSHLRYEAAAKESRWERRRGSRRRGRRRGWQRGRRRRRPPRREGRGGRRRRVHVRRWELVSGLTAAGVAARAHTKTDGLSDSSSDRPDYQLSDSN